MPWLCAMAYLRLGTHPAIYPSPLSVSEAVDFLGRLMSSSSVVNGEPDRHHLERVTELLAPLGRGGNLVNDAHLADLALQDEATVVSYDNDFGQFPGVRWMRPSDPE